MVPSSRTFDYFCHIKEVNVKFIETIVAEGVLERCQGKERYSFRNWATSLKKLKTTGSNQYANARKVCGIVFGKYYKAKKYSVFHCSDVEDVYDELFKWGQAFDYNDKDYNTLKSNVDLFRRNQGIQKNFLAQFSDEDRKDIRLCKSEKTRERRRNFNLGFSVLNFISIIIPSCITAALVFLLLYKWIPLEQFFISLGFYPMNGFYLATLVSALAGLFSFVLGIILYAVFSRAKQNPPVQVIGLRILSIEIAVVIINLLFWGCLAIFCFFVR